MDAAGYKFIHQPRYLDNGIKNNNSSIPTDLLNIIDEYIPKKLNPLYMSGRLTYELPPYYDSKLSYESPPPPPSRHKESPKYFSCLIN